MEGGGLWGEWWWDHSAHPTPNSLNPPSQTNHSLPYCNPTKHTQGPRSQLLDKELQRDEGGFPSKGHEEASWGWDMWLSQVTTVGSRGSTLWGALGYRVGHVSMLFTQVEPQLPSRAYRGPKDLALWACPRWKGAGTCTRTLSARQQVSAYLIHHYLPHPSSRTITDLQPTHSAVSSVSPLPSSQVSCAQCFLCVKHDYLIYSSHQS